MIYRFSKISIGLYVIVTLGLCGLLAVVIGMIEKNYTKGCVWFMLGAVFSFFAFVKTIPTYQNRYVEFKDDFVTFYCCFAKKKSNSETVTVAYKHISHIHFQRFPWPKTYNLLINAANYPYTISVSCFFEKRKELQSYFIKKVMEENPNVIITGIKKIR